LVFVSTSIAATTNVHIQTNTGQNTVCVNGKCTTSDEGNGQSTVCVNGKCYTTDEGTIDVKSEDGNDTVHVGTTSSEGATISPQKVMHKEILQDKKAAIAEKKKEIKEKIQEKHFDLGNLLRRLFAWVF